MKVVLFLLCIVLLLIGIIVLIGGIILLYDEALDVIEKHHKKHDMERRRP